jgi:ATP/ADP translocase
VTGTEEEINEMLNLTDSSSSLPSSSLPLSVPTPPIPPPERSLLTKTMIVFAGFYEGLLLILKYPYVFHIFLITCLFEVVLTIMDYEFKILGSHQTEIIPDTGTATDSSSDNFANLMGHFGYSLSLSLSESSLSQVTNVVSLVISFVGFSLLVHRIGVRFTLLIFPIVMLLAVIVTNLVPSLWALFLMVSVLKALVYSLNDPVVELLYMPTSEPIKFKAKAWIDVVGARSAKAIASIVTSLSGGNIQKLRQSTEVPMIIICFAFIAIVWITGKEFDQLVEKKIIIGEELEHREVREIHERRRRCGGMEELIPETVFEGVDFDLPDGGTKGDSSLSSSSSATLTNRTTGIRPFQMEDFSTPGGRSKSQSIWRSDKG